MDNQNDPRSVLLAGKARLGHSDAEDDAGDGIKENPDRVIPHRCPVRGRREYGRVDKNLNCDQVMDKATQTICPTHGDISDFLLPKEEPGYYKTILDLGKLRLKKEQEEAAIAAKTLDYVGDCPVRINNSIQMKSCKKPIWGTYCEEHGNLDGLLKQASINKSGFIVFQQIEAKKLD